MKIGRKIYYDKATGNVYVTTSEMAGDVVETTQDQDFQTYTALQGIDPTTVGCLQLDYGQDAENFAKYPYHVDVSQSPPVIAWDTTATDLANAKTQKIAQLRDQYAQTLAAGFQATIGTTAYTFGWADSDITHMNATQQAVGKGYLTFPILYADVNGSPVSIPDQATLDSIEQAATQFMVAKHQEVLNLVGQAQSATTVADVQAVTW